MTINRRQLFKDAWEIARTRSAKSGQSVKVAFKLALAAVWAAAMDRPASNTCAWIGSFGTSEPRFGAGTPVPAEAAGWIGNRLLALSGDLVNAHDLLGKCAS